MRHQESHWATWPAVGLYLLVIGHGTGLHEWWDLLGTAERASWVQAVGSVLAIVASAWLVARQVEHQREIEREKEARLDMRRLYAIAVVLRSLRGLTKEFHERFESLPPDQRRESFLALNTHELERLTTTLQGFHFFEFPRAELIEQIDHLLFHMLRAVDDIKRTKGALDSGKVDFPDAFDSISKRIKNIDERARDTLSYCDYRVESADPSLRF